jgi:molybdopterin converting factor subunit 1
MTEGRRITLLYFAALRELAGASREEVLLPSSLRTIADLRAHLDARDALRNRLSSVRFARNEEFANDADTLGEGDVVALIPPVAGG